VRAAGVNASLSAPTHRSEARPLQELVADCSDCGRVARDTLATADFLMLHSGGAVLLADSVVESRLGIKGGSMSGRRHAIAVRTAQLQSASEASFRVDSSAGMDFQVLLLDLPTFAHKP